ncbi:uracil-DNA glycosylase [Parvibaculum sp.]|uniref:uracil-DNA glycosylase n=1 Tax=Parvibaculum sp. TaxID=2024848 RepID=UPI0032EEC49C
MKTPKTFVAAISELSLDAVFNPYRDCCPINDRADAAKLRRRNLTRCLESAIEGKVETIWIARDLGYRGGRRTGIPLTDETHLNAASAMFGGIGLDKATRGPVIAERTAAVVWRLLSSLPEPVMLWNVFPLHPHQKGDPLSNRCHTRIEREVTWPFINALMAMLKPQRIIAIGRDAAEALTAIDIPISSVRHPSYGGQAEFTAGVQALYGLTGTDLRGQDGLTLPGLYAGSSAPAT